MPASQLKRLKASLRDQGIVGPQKSKKQRKRNAQDEGSRNERRLQRGAALDNIREQFNPFQFKNNARGPKFEVTSYQNARNASRGGAAQGRPGISKAIGEERREQTILVEMQRRSKVGGLLDRRLGEGDSNLTPEAVMAERFALEKARSHKKSSMFDLEDDEPTIGLTHMGKTLDLGEDELRDDFDEDDVSAGDDSDASDSDSNKRKRLKRLREDVAGFEKQDDEAPERKKSKKEVMEEVMAKSKMHKYERQAAKEDDEELRLELDGDMAQIRSLLFGGLRKDTASSDPANGLNGSVLPVDKKTLEKDYDLDVRKLAVDKRSKPATRTKTSEELLEEHNEQLQELEERRLKRMRGEEDSEDSDAAEDDEEEENADNQAVQILPADGDQPDFGLGKGVKPRQLASEIGHIDEDDFLIDDDLVASGSDIDVDGELDSDDEFSGLDEDGDADSDDEFTHGLVIETGANGTAVPKSAKALTEDILTSNFACPQTHSELLEIVDAIPIRQVPTIIQRIRALYHPKLSGDNRAKMAAFSKVLVHHVSYLHQKAGSEDLYPALESLIRHIHSLAKSYPIDIAEQFRSELEEIGRERPLNMHEGDLYLLTAIGTIFPTSDHFHQVVTPAQLTIGRYLGQKVPETLSDYATGVYLSVVALQYQKMSKRYMPEVMNFTLNTLCALAPRRWQRNEGFFPVHEPKEGVRIGRAESATVRKLRCTDCRVAASPLSPGDSTSLKVAILDTSISIIDAAAATWADKPAFYETFSPAPAIFNHLSKASKENMTYDKTNGKAPTAGRNSTHLPADLVSHLKRSSTLLQTRLAAAQFSRRPLQLHKHRPLAIKSFAPKFEDSFDPNKHYDPDRERAEMSKLRAEHKKEKKGAMRELRRDASFVARERLRAKKDKDAAYEKKYKRLVAEVQGSEGMEANAYEREKRKRAKR